MSILRSLALIHHLGVGQAVVLGNSFAAGAALWATRTESGTVRGIGFAGPWRNGFWMTYWDSLFPLCKPADHSAYRARLAANLREPGRMAALQTLIGLPKAETEALVGKVPVPALVVMGSRDPDFADPIAEATWLATRMKARVSMIDGAGHYPHVESPGQVAEEIQRFIDRLKAG